MTSPISPRAILIDLDGTLADSLSVMRIAYRRFLEQFQVEPSDAEFDSLNGPPLPEVVRRLKGSHALEGAEEMLLANYYDVIDQSYGGVVPRHGAIDLLQMAKKNHCTVGIVTSNSAKRTLTWLETVSLSHLIGFIVSGDELKHGKPHPEPYLLASKKALCPAAEIVAVEDSSQGARSAVDAGLKTFILIHGDSSHSWPDSAVPINSLVELSKQLW